MNKENGSVHDDIAMMMLPMVADDCKNAKK